MNKKIIYVVGGALLVLALIVLMWFLLFGKQPSQPSGGTGSFGSAQDKNTGTSGTGSTVGNGQTQLGSNAGSGTAEPVNQQTYIPSSNVPVASETSSAPPSEGPSYLPGITWVTGTSPLGSGKIFTPTPINELNTVDVSGTAYFKNSGSGSGGNATTAGLVGCTAGLLVGAANSAISSVLLSGIAVTTNAPAQNAKDADTLMKDFLSCIARTIARAALEKITSNVVDWVNSGFNGQPQFVQDYKQFFLDAANQAAGEFIQGTSFSFLCSPIQNQVKVAIAQSYARQQGSTLGGTGGAPNSCTLTDSVNNINGFINGDFSQGGWNGLLAYTTVPTNNAFGAYSYEQQTLDQVQAQAVVDASRMVSPGGYLSQVDPKTGKIVSPAGTVEGIIQNALNLPTQTLNAAKNFDEIIATLLTQLVDRTIYQGLSQISGQNGYASNFSNAKTQQAADAAQALLTNLQASVQFASQYGSVEQGSISDLQNAQVQLQNLSNCWSTAASSTNLSAAQQSQAQANAASADSQIQSLEARVTLYNTQITRANSAMAEIQQLQTQALAAQTVTDVQAVQTKLQSDQTSGVVLTQADVTQVQQDRTTLQAEMTALNTDTNARLNQCYVFGQ